ncbi:BMP family lipoprotein [Candidatus Methanocrinis alkalitolerans]|uniref:BMP family lipoprotein n=1 Tax=Candidatus Methanocrinis alkalitolerans TaxID=3033395 RepID=UPI002934E0E7|nr:BMP family ABC transporter substrate-binding protein [Candidatus Methanocrinis alkalitolerans]
MVVHFINGALGDGSFFDSAARGIAEAEAELGIEVVTIEAGYNSSAWRELLEAAAAGEDYDLLITGTALMRDLLSEVAKKHPDKRFIIYDSSVDYSEGSYENVYSVVYRQNEGAYLAGVYAALMTESGTIGILGGQNSTTINDFVVGYRQGAQSVGPEVVVLVEYAESWDDPALGEALAAEMYGKGADIIFQAAGTTGLGVFRAAAESGKYAIGVDSDQAMMIEETDPEEASTILTSMMKNVDASLLWALELYVNGVLPFGGAETLGIREGGVGLARNDRYDEATPAAVKAAIDRAELEIREGRTRVKTAF